MVGVSVWADIKMGEYTSVRGNGGGTTTGIIMRARRPPRASSPAVGSHGNEVVASVSGIERRRLLQWVLAWAGLSSTWMLEEADEPGITLGVAQLAAAALR